MGQETSRRAAPEVLGHPTETSDRGREDAEVAWLIYDLRKYDPANEYRLELGEVVYTQFQPALDSITTPAVGVVEDFEQKLQEKLDEKLDSSPNAPILGEVIEEEPEV